MKEKNSKYLLISLQKDRPEYKPLSSLGSAVTFGGESYKITDSGSNGFYDWLRASSGDIVGVRLWFFEDYWVVKDESFLNYVSSKLTYSKWNIDDQFLEVYFYNSVDVDLSQSDDQEFGFNSVLKSEEGLYVIVIDVMSLDSNDLRTMSEKSGSPISLS